MKELSPGDEATKALLTLELRAWVQMSGGEFCDKCGEAIWPEDELVRCDFCWGKHGAPDLERMKQMEKKHWDRIRAYEREQDGSYWDEGYD